MRAAAAVAAAAHILLHFASLVLWPPLCFDCCFALRV